MTTEEFEALAREMLTQYAELAVLDGYGFIFVCGGSVHRTEIDQRPATAMDIFGAATPNLTEAGEVMLLSFLLQEVMNRAASRGDTVLNRVCAELHGRLSETYPQMSTSA